MAGSYGKYILNSLVNYKTVFPKWLYHIAFPTAVYVCPGFPISSPTLDMGDFLDYRHSSGLFSLWF